MSQELRNPHGTPYVRALIREIDRASTCGMCGADFDSDTRQHYCSRACAEKARRKRNREWARRRTKSVARDVDRLLRRTL